jgi:hypothetical protein
MGAQQRFPGDTLAAIRDAKILRIRAGTAGHRFIGIWAVVVDRRVFVRSWSVSADGWYRAFRARPRGAIQLGARRISVRAVHTRSARLLDAVDRAYLEKYQTPGSIEYARDLARPESRATTTELVPT